MHELLLKLSFLNVKMEIWHIEVLQWIPLRRFHLYMSEIQPIVGLSLVSSYLTKNTSQSNVAVCGEIGSLCGMSSQKQQFFDVYQQLLPFLSLSYFSHMSKNYKELPGLSVRYVWGRGSIRSYGWLLHYRSAAGSALSFRYLMFEWNCGYAASHVHGWVCNNSSKTHALHPTNAASSISAVAGFSDIQSGLVCIPRQCNNSSELAACM